MRLCSTGLAAAWLLICCSGSHAAVLYNGSLGTVPSAQGWYYVTAPLTGASATQSAGVGATTLDTTPVPGESAGYPNIVPIFPPHPGVGVLDSSAGFVLRFTVQVVSENHSGSTDRAGFSVIVIDSNRKGVELGFWTNEVWAQTDTPLFTHSATEYADFDTTAAVTRYDLAFHGSTYSLSVAGSPLFDGLLKDYSAFNHVAAGLPMAPYETPSFVFFGDDTGSASAKVAISRVDLVPEPASAAILLLGWAAVRGRRRRPAG